MEMQISVRTLVEFLLRGGDIDNRIAAGSEEAMQEGAKIHRMIQKRMGSEYQAEVPLSFVADFGDYSVKVEGRADGIIHEKKGVTVDEIKGTYRDIFKMMEPDPVHLAQARCYAYMISQKEELSEITVRMTYVHMKSLEIRYFHEKLSVDEITRWFEDLMAQYKKWTDFEYAWKRRRDESLQALEFPYTFREGQKELAGHVYQTICHGKKLFIQAPTGVGKTLSCVFPSLKAMGLGKADKIFYLTAKTVTRAVAQETFSLLSEHGMALKALTITAKEKICPMMQIAGEQEDARDPEKADEAAAGPDMLSDAQGTGEHGNENSEKKRKLCCNPEACPYAAGHFDRVNDAVYELLTTRDVLDREAILAAAQRHMVCPFEMSLDVSLFADSIICDYNYLFDPYVSLKRFFAEGSKGNWIFLVDEAHNLLERGRSMYSAQLCKEDVLALKREIKGKKTGLEKGLDRVNREMLTLKKEGDGRISASERGTLDQAVVRLLGEMGEFLEQQENSPAREQVLEFYFMLRRYSDVLESYDEHYLTYTYYHRKDERFYVRMLCVDPSEQLDHRMKQGVSSILFSATLLPIQYYKGLLGGKPEDFEVYAKTSFSREQFALLIGRDVTTKYTERSDVMYERIAAHIHKIVCGRAGNYMIFCPSHDFSEKVSEAYRLLYHHDEAEEILLQSPYMDETERELFLERFRGQVEAGEMGTSGDSGTGPATLLGFCVMGGIFGEGIDLKGEDLIGVIVVGTGIPQISMESELLKTYFDERGDNGFDYAYRYPGMNKVLQAAGRLIRTDQDRGVIALLDYRFCQNAYQRLCPREWEGHFQANAEEIGAYVRSFWDNQEQKNLGTAD